MPIILVGWSAVKGQRREEAERLERGLDPAEYALFFADFQRILARTRAEVAGIALVVAVGVVLVGVGGHGAVVAAVAHAVAVDVQHLDVGVVVFGLGDRRGREVDGEGDQREEHEVAERLHDVPRPA